MTQQSTFAMHATIEVLCLGFDPSGLGVGARPRLPDHEMAFTTATDRPSVRQAFARPERWDLLLCRSTAYYDLGIDRWLAESAGVLLAPMILVRPPATQLSPAEAARRGAADIVNHGDREHLEMVMARELACLRLRKELDARKATGASTAVVLPKISDYGRFAPRTDAKHRSRVPAAPTVDGDLGDPWHDTAVLEPVPEEMDDQRVKALIECGGLTLEVQRNALRHESEALSRLRATLKQHKHGLLMEQFNAADCDLLRDNLDWVTHVKLDRALLQDLALADINREILHKLVHCARNHGVKIIALAVDNAEILPELYALGVDYIQGHFVSMPYEELVYPDVFNVDMGPK